MWGVLLRSMVFSAGMCFAAVATADAPSPTVINYKKPPEPSFAFGVVRVWKKARGHPSLQKDYTPEARAGDSIVVEVKDLEQWLASILDQGTWDLDPEVLKTSAAVHQLITNRGFRSSMRAGRWL